MWQDPLPTPEGGALNRRAFLKAVVVATGTVTVPVWPGASDDVVAGKLRLLDGTAFFPQSIASGDPTAQSVICWTRVTDAERRGDLRLRFQVFEDPDGLRQGDDDVIPENSMVVNTMVTARIEHDGCVRVKVVGLRPRTTYRYRFMYRKRLRLYTTRLGRTRTAPQPHDPVSVRFALASCQDYIGKYYNSYLPLLEDAYADLAFLLQVGDFVYETTGDPTFQEDRGDRTIVFDDEAGAIKFGADPEHPTYLAARSLSNYRQLYRTYRSDEALQAVLAKFPLIPIWDDHEFTNDGWQHHSTYGNGRGLLPDNGSVRIGDGSANRLEADLERRHNAERAYFEYMPIDDDDADDVSHTRDLIDTGEDRLFPHTRLYRGMRFGHYCNLSLTDYRTYRPNHAVDEAAFPATVLYPEEAIRDKYVALFGADGPERFEHDKRLFTKRCLGTGAPVPDLDHGNPSGLREYVDWDDVTLTQRHALMAQVIEEYKTAGYSQEAAAEKTADVLQGFLDIEYLNRVIRSYNRRNDADVAEIPLNIAKGPSAIKNPYGLCNVNLHKIDLLSLVGARYATSVDWYELWRALESDRVGGGVPADEDAYGEVNPDFDQHQETWLRRHMMASDAVWEFVVSSVSSTSILVDLGNPLPVETEPALADVEVFRQLLVLALQTLGLESRFYLSCDQWDGQPNQRYALHRFYRQQGNVVQLAGDIHSSWITDFTTDEGPLYGFTGTSVSSATFGGVLLQILDLLQDPGTARSSASLAASLSPRPAAPFAAFLRQSIATFGAHIEELFASLPEHLPAGEPLAAMQDLLGNLTTGDAAARLTGLIAHLIAVLDRFFLAREHHSAFLQTDDGTSKIASTLVGLDSAANGVVVIDVQRYAVDATYLLIRPQDVEVSFYDNPHDLPVTTRRFRVSERGLRKLERDSVRRDNAGAKRQRPTRDHSGSAAGPLVQ